MTHPTAPEGDGSIVFHGINCGGRAAPLTTIGRLRAIVGRFELVVADISGDERLLNRARAGLPAGAALTEAAAVRLRREGVELTWGEPITLRTPRDLIAYCAARGRSSVEIARADPSLLTELQLGSWFDSVWWLRLVRRLGIRAGRVPVWAELRLAADAAFWRGVRSRATTAEWKRWTRASYTALVYHRLAGERKDGQERIDLAPKIFARQLRALRRLGFRHLEPHELLAIHEGNPPDSVRRAFVVTVDDGLLDCREPLIDCPERGIQLFISTAEVGGRAHWLDDEPLLDWNDIRRLATASVFIGSHARHHRRLTGLTPTELIDELASSRQDLGRELGAAPPFVAYPHGAHDPETRRAAAEAGYQAAFTTAQGRNGAGTDRFCLRRVSVHEADGVLAVLWKVATGEKLPLLWVRARRLHPRRRRNLSRKAQ